MMKEKLKKGLTATIDKYLKGLYSEIDFQDELNSLISGITEIELSDIREFLLRSEGKLELINYLVEKREHRKEYEKVIVEIENYLELSRLT